MNYLIDLLLYVDVLTERFYSLNLLPNDAGPTDGFLD
jgi:hypothetical protein